MLKHIFNGAVRHLWRNKAFSLINLLGLVTGLVSSFCIASYIYHENSYDRMHPDGANTYRLVSEKNASGKNDKALSAFTFLPITGFIENKIQEIKEIARVKPVQLATLQVGTEVFIEKDFIWADASLLYFFDIHFLQGDATHALEMPNSVILTKKEAAKLFGTENPMGKSISIDNQNLTITGIIADIPSNMHLKMNLVGSIQTLKNLDDPWSQQGHVYLKLTGQSDLAKTSAKINNAMKGNVWWLKDPPVFQLQPVRDIHLYSRDIIASPDPVDIRYLYIFGLIGLILIFSTSFNYISISISDLSTRKKDFGIQRILGSNKWHTIAQPLAECVLLCSIAAVVAVVVSSVLLPVVNNLLDTEINQSFFLSLPNLTILFFVVFLLLMASAIYPAALILGFRPLYAIRKAVSAGTSGFAARKLLMTAQFAIAIVLVIAVIVIQKQMKYLSSERLGFSKDQVLVLKTPRFSKINAPLMKQQLMQLSGVSSVTVSAGTPFGGGISFLADKDGLSYNLSQFYIDHDYIHTLGMEMVSGLDLTPADSNKVIVNEAMVRTMGWDQPLGQNVDFFGEKKEVKGVARDFQLNNIHTGIHPAALALGNKYISTILVRLKTDQISQNLEEIENAWKKAEPEHPMEYGFLDEQFEQLFHAEIQFQQLSKIFSMIAILIACLGLYGAIAYATQKRVKEIGIRKVLGSSVTGIAQLLSKEYVGLVLSAFIIASPVAWWAMNKWLQDFAYRIEIRWWMPALAGLASIVIALITVSYQAIKAAMVNPVESLRSE